MTDHGRQHYLVPSTAVTTAKSMLGRWFCACGAALSSVAQSREHALAEHVAATSDLSPFETMLASHYPHPAFGCECTPEDDATGIKEVLAEPWERHIAGLVAALSMKDECTPEVRRG